MFCFKCGNALADDAAFCTKCGSAVNQNAEAQPAQTVNAQPASQPASQPAPQPASQPAPQAAPQPVQPVYTQQPTYTQQPIYTQPVQPTQPMYNQQAPMYNQQAPMYNQPVQNPYIPQQVGLPMNWFKALIYAILFISAALNLVNGIRLLTGTIYGSDGESKWIYENISDLEVLDKFIGIACLGAAAFAIYARFQLAAYKRNSPNFITVLYVISMAINLVYIIGVVAIFDGKIGGDSIIDDMITQYVTSIIVSIAMIVANRTYFQKRAHLFVN